MIKPRPALQWRHFEAEIIVCAVRWYLRFSLSYRDVEELLMERGRRADHTTVWSCVLAPRTRTESEMPARLSVLERVVAFGVVRVDRPLRVQDEDLGAVLVLREPHAQLALVQRCDVISEQRASRTLRSKKTWPGVAA
jgi:hypothetical protein